MKVLITGANGFIGKNLQLHLAEREGEQCAAPRQPVGIETGRKTADAEAQKEGADHQGRGDRVGAREQTQQSMPGRLVDQGCST